MNCESFLYNNACAQETDAGHDALNHARRVAGTVGREMPGKRGSHQQRRTERYQCIGSHTRRTAMKGTLEPDEATRQERGNDSQHDIVFSHGHGRRVPHLWRIFRASFAPLSRH